MADAGLFAGRRVELVEGEIFRMSPQKSAHATALTLATALLVKKFPPGYAVRVQLPLAIDTKTELEPGIAVVRGQPRDHLKGHPSTAALVIEVADTSLQYDRTTKSRLYAKAGIPDYWIIDLVHRHIEVRRQPARVPKKLEGEEYGLISIHRMRETVHPLAAPEMKIAVKDLLP
jgi:Uma2 family endonuclease